MISTFVFAAYFTRGVAPAETTGPLLWGNAPAISALLVALMSAPLGAIADQSGRRKPWLAALTAITILATLGLWGVLPDDAFITRALVLVVIATVAFEFASVFYNAMLPEIASPRVMGRISGSMAL